jgi:hypothetical protein
VAESRDTGNDDGQCDCLAGQIQDPGLDVFAEQEQEQQASPEWVKDRESRLRPRQRAGRQRVGGQQHRPRAGKDEHVRRPVGGDGADAVTEVRAEFLDHGGRPTWLSTIPAFCSSRGRSPPVDSRAPAVAGPLGSKSVLWRFNSASPTGFESYRDSGAGDGLDLL